MAEDKIADALQILGELGMPRAQRNDRSALCLLALLNLTKEKSWARAKSPLVGITPMNLHVIITASSMRRTLAKPFAGRPFIKWSRPDSPLITRTTLRGL